MEFKLPLDHSIVRPADLQALSDLSTEFPQPENPVVFQLIITASVEVVDFDPSWLGYLFLLKRNHKGISIILKLPYNYEFRIRPEPIAKLRQYITYAFVFLGMVPISVEAADGKLDFASDKFQENSFVISQRFGVPLFIDKEQPLRYKEIFGNTDEAFKTSLLPGAEKEIQWTANADELDATIRRLYRSRSKPGNLEACSRNLGKIAFFRVLSLTWTLTVYLDPDRISDSTKISKNCRAGNLRSTRGKGEMSALDYFQKVEPIINDIKNRPLIYIFIFNMLLSEEMLPSILDQKNAEEFALNLRKRWSFCLDLVHGLTELAKNIKEHSSTGFGIISSRIATNKNTGDIEYPWYDEFLDQLPMFEGKTKHSSILEIQVSDLGNDGIVPKLLKNIESSFYQKNIPASIRDIYEQDANRIKNGSVTLPGLLMVNKVSPLNHQSKRAVAHLGLLIFSKLIEENGGQLIAISNSLNGQRESATVPQDRPVIYPKLSRGTIFRFLLPVREGTVYDTRLMHSTDLTPEITQEQVIGLEALLEFDIKRMDQVYPNEELTGKKIIFSIVPAPWTPEDHADEFAWWKGFESSLKNIKLVEKDSANKIAHIDMSELRIDASHLFRFLGIWEIQYPKVPLLLSNVDQEQFEKLTEINHHYHLQNPNLDYWNKIAPVIVYSIVKDPKDLDRKIYFVDALWGEKPADYFQLNKIIQKYHYNSVTWINKLKGENKGQEMVEQSNFTVPPAFFYRKHFLLPFDLILELGDGFSLFETNAQFFLQNDIQPCLSKDELITR